MQGFRISGVGFRDLGFRFGRCGAAGGRQEGQGPTWRPVGFSNYL